MTSVKIVDLCQAFTLNVKNEIDTVQPEIRKPEAETSGLIIGESGLEPRTHRSSDVPILSGSPKSYNTLGATMTTPFLKYPSLLQSDEYRKLTSSQRSVLLALVEHSALYPYQYDFFGLPLNLQPGQCCTTLNLIREWSGKVSIKIIRNCIEKFEFYGWIKVEILKREKIEGKKRARVGAHERAHVKTLITLKFKGIYDSNNYLKGTSEGTCEGTTRAHKEDIRLEEREEYPKSLMANLRDCGNVHNQERERADLKIEFKNGKFVNIRKLQKERWKEQFPNLNIDVAIQKFEYKKPRKSDVPWESRLLSWFEKLHQPIQKSDEKIENGENTFDEDKEYVENLHTIWNLNYHEIDIFASGVVIRCGMWQRDFKFGESKFKTKVNELLRGRGCQLKRNS